MFLYGQGLDCVAGTVSVRAITFLPLPSMAWAHLFPLDTPTTSHINEQARFSQGQCCILGEQPWMGLAWIASLGRLGVNSKIAVWLGLEPSTDFGDKCLLRPAVQSVCRRLATFALVYMLAFISLGLQSTGLRWPKQLVFWCLNREPGRFWFLPIFEKEFYWGPFHIHIFPLFLVCQSLASGAGPLELAS